jgi:4a-hydroxytetrahydrobiopterin dehydratase
MKLQKAEIKSKLSALPGWELDDDEIQKKYKFEDFKSALAIANKVGDLAEAADHHPDMEVGWGKVKIELSTHSEGGVTEKDFALATQIEGLGAPAADGAKA